MIGPEVPRKHQEAMCLDIDRKNGNRNWTESEKMKASQPLDYKISKDLGHKSNSAAPKSYKMITLHLVHAVIVPIYNPSTILFVDIKHVIDNMFMPNQQPPKRHLMLSYYYIREALASGD